jgi:hypothetical protein
MQDVIIQDYPDIEPNPSTPTSMLYDILDLQRECHEKKKAYVNVEINANGTINVWMTNDIVISEYSMIDDYHIAPKVWHAMDRYEFRYNDAYIMAAIIETLREYLA